MSTLPHNPLPDSPPSQDLDGDASNQTIKAPVSPPMVSSERDIPLREDEATEYPEVNEQLRAEVSLQLRHIAYRIQDVGIRIGSVSTLLTQYRSNYAVLLDVTETLRVSGESEVPIQATDAEDLSVVQSISTLSDALGELFDMAMSKFKACYDDLDRIEQETAEFLKYSISLKTALTEEEINALHSLRVTVPGEIRLRKARILTEVRSYW